MKKSHTIVRTVDSGSDARELPEEIRKRIEEHRKMRRYVQKAYEEVMPRAAVPTVAGRVLARARDTRPGVTAKAYHVMTEVFFPRRVRWCASCALAACVIMIAALGAIPLITSSASAAHHESFVIYRTENGHILYQYIEYEDANE